jgi:hypothetical protein
VFESFPGERLARNILAESDAGAKRKNQTGKKRRL